MTDSSRVVDTGDLRTYRTEIPNLIDDLDLSVYAFRLYVHLKRVAGASEDGACWQSTRTLASHCQMSASKVSESKQELVQAGLIEIEPGDHTKGKADVITIVNVWPQNFAKYTPVSEPKKANEPVRTANTQDLTCSHSEHPVRTANTPVRVAVHKKEPIKKEPIKKDDDAQAPVAVTVDGRRRRHAQTDADFGAICRKYENEFGFLSPIAADTLNDMLDEYKSANMVMDAFDMAVMANKRSLRYVEGVLRNWRAEGKTGKPDPSQKQSNPKPTGNFAQSYVAPDLMAELERISHDQQRNGAH